MKHLPRTHRRSFLAGAGKLGLLLAGGPHLAAAAGLGRGAQAPDLAAETRPVKEITRMVRLLGLMQRGPGFSKSEVTVKSQQSYWPFARNGYPLAVKQMNWEELQHIQNVVTDAAFGVEGQTPRMTFNPDVVAEFAMQMDVPGVTQRPVTAAGLCQLPLPEFIDRATHLAMFARQVFAEGIRPASMDGREKGMYFIKMSPAIPAADQLKTFQALHAKAVEGSAAFAAALTGHEILQRAPEVPPGPCAAVAPAPDLVATFWFTANRGALQIPNYVRALRKADERKAVDAAASFFLRVEEWEARTGPTYVG